MATRRFPWNSFVRIISIHLVVLIILTCAGLIWLVSSDDDSQPTRHYDAKVIQKVAPKPVNSTWRFETISAGKRVDGRSPSLALDSEGSPRMAYGGSRLYYAWLDGSAWQKVIVDARPGAGNQTRLLFDAAGRPHIVYSVGDNQNMFLAHAYRNSSGWQRETVSADFCQMTIHQISFDPQGWLAVIFNGRPCSPPDSSDHLWFALQAADRWHIKEIASEGNYASLAYDPSGQANVTYSVHSSSALYLATGSGQGWTARQIGDGLRDYSKTYAFFDPQAALHVIYTVSSTNGDWIKHAWRDTSGWHFEDALKLPSQTSLINVLTGVEGQPILIFRGQDKGVFQARREASGWKLAPESPYAALQLYYSPDVKMDPGGRYHLVYTTAEGSLFYATGQGNTWQTVALDGDIAIDRALAALAFDRNGGLAAGYFGSDDWVHYIWKDGDAWRKETVGKASESKSESPIDLIFDAQNRPHIFYIGPDGDRKGPRRLVHAFRDQDRWKAETLDFTVYGLFDRARAVISPEGWPVFYREIAGSHPESTLIYCPPQGCQKQYLAYFSPRVQDLGYPAIAYPPQMRNAATSIGAFSASSPNTSLSIPGFAYMTRGSEELAWIDPRKEREEILPILDKNDEINHFSLAYNPQGMPVIFAGVYHHNKSWSDVTTDLLYATWDQDEYGWKAYQFEGMYYPTYDPAVDSTGQAHFVHEEFPNTASGRRHEIYYVTGSGPDWKITPIQSVGFNRDHVELWLAGSTASPDTGEFCTLVNNRTTNDLIIGCLDKLE